MPLLALAGGDFTPTANRVNLLRQHLTRIEWALFAIAALAASVAAAELAADQVNPPRHATVLAALSRHPYRSAYLARTLKRWRTAPRTKLAGA